jgi:hypothetical protein
MTSPLPSWCFRDLETSITWLMDAGANAATVENDENIPKHIRELVSDTRTNIKATLMLLKEIRSQHELIVKQNATEAKDTSAGD